MLAGGGTGSGNRVLAALRHEQPDRTPCNFGAEPPTTQRTEHERRSGMLLGGTPDNAPFPTSSCGTLHPFGSVHVDSRSGRGRKRRETAMHPGDLLSTGWFHRCGTAGGVFVYSSGGVKTVWSFGIWSTNTLRGTCEKQAVLPLRTPSRHFQPISASRPHSNRSEEVKASSSFFRIARSHP